MVLEIPVNASFKKNLFAYAQKFSHLAWLDSHMEISEYAENNQLSLLVGLGKKSEVVVPLAGMAFEHLKTFLQQPKWAFGFLSYDLKNEIEAQLFSGHLDELHFPELYFFEPEVLIQMGSSSVKITTENNTYLNEISALNSVAKELEKEQISLNPQARISKDKYLEKVREIQQKILRGDVYEINFCHEFFVEDCELNPAHLYHVLTNLSPAPFASYFKKDQHFILSASPERFLKKSGSTILSQPIKGTVHRGKTTQEDELLKQQLWNSSKERSENVMIVDLVRNDLSHIATDGSVKVEELFGIYTFPQVHQMISSISCELKPNVHPVEAIKACFPMGSMTGAPKVKAMQIIEEMETTKRGVFSGSIGYFNPEGDFDFNVLIRSIFYNELEKKLSFSVGSAITHYASAEEEYQETLLKAKAIFEVLGGN